MGERVLVGFSGGVDSAMAALLLREAGYEVVGAMMSVKDDSGHGCGVTEDADAARRLADRIGIPLAVVDLSRPYRELVLDYFRFEYLAGRTPNPCIRCNPLVKFGLLPELARRQGLDADRFATGHYARIEFASPWGRHVLRRGSDQSKDQSYFLYRLPPEQLSRILFPLGDRLKSDVRADARRRGLPVHDKPDSQDFYAGDYADLLGAAEAEGDIVDVDGKILGKHRGYWRYTPGQRKGLGVAFREPLYVIRLDPARNEVVVGTRDQQLRNGCVITDTVFHLPEPTPGVRLLCRVRSAQPLHEMVVGERDAEGGLAVHFARPQHGVAPGQSLVMYDGDVVVGGGIIAKAL